MPHWVHGRGVKRRLIEPGKPNQNTYVEFSKGRLRDGCLNENWFINLQRAKSVIETWRREHDEELHEAELHLHNTFCLKKMYHLSYRLLYSLMRSRDRESWRFRDFIGRINTRKIR